jgi:hypothetical protein
VEILTDSKDIKQYIKKLKSRDPQLFLNWGTICTLVEMTAADGKKRKVQASNTEGLFRIIQSIPSAKAEPFKQWLAQVGYERIEETEDPELSFDRAMETYPAKGYTNSWINQRLKSIGVIAGNARTQIEAKTGKKVVSKLNAKNIADEKSKQKKLK